MNDIIETTDQKKDKGFTPIELLIVIVILGILATVTVFAVAGITNRGQDSACSAELKTLEVAIEAYQAQTGGYPAAMTDLTDNATTQFIRSAPTYWGLDPAADGSIVKTAAGDADCGNITVF